MEEERGNEEITKEIFKMSTRSGEKYIEVHGQKRTGQRYAKKNGRKKSMKI